MMVGAYLVFHSCEHAELTLYSHIVLVGIFDYFLCQGHILLVGKVRTVDHH